jgi:hypothetical protein
MFSEIIIRYGERHHNLLDRDWAKFWRLPHTRELSAKVRSLLVARRASLPRPPLRQIATSALGRIYPHLIIRVSRSLDTGKANFLFARIPTEAPRAARADQRDGDFTAMWTRRTVYHGGIMDKCPCDQTIPGFDWPT